MAITNTQKDGLSHTYEVTITAKDLNAKLESRITELQPQMKLKGFRPGKVPRAHIEQMFGKSLMQELLEKTIDESKEQAVKEADIKPASNPAVELRSNVEAVINGTADLVYELNVDVMPEFDVVDISGKTLKRPTTPVEDKDLDEALEKLAENNNTYEAKKATAKAKDGDAVMVDFVGKIDGEPFEGGASQESEEGTPIVIGAARFIPGFEEQLIGVKKGDDVVIKVTFPEDYQAPDLAGKEAEFDVKVHEVRGAKTPELDDDFAKGLGLEGLDNLKDMLKQQIEAERANFGETKLRRGLLDVIDENHQFELPPRMVKQEFEQIWQQLVSEKEAGRLSDEDMAKSDEDLKAEYNTIAERRVRLGLVLAEVGTKEKVVVTEDELRGALAREIQKYPGQEQMVLDFYQKNPGAMAGLRAPIFEDKVVKLLLDQVTIEDEIVALDDLMEVDE